MSILSLVGLSARYGPAQALFDVSFDVGEGEAVALMGRNGMGKTTTIHSICRLLRTTGGRIVFDGLDLGGLTSALAARRGLGLVPEGRRVFRGLSVEDNLSAAARPGDWDLSRVYDLFPVLAERRTQAAHLLSGGEQQMLVIGRALMTNPRLLLLDEATEGLAPVIRKEIWQVIASLKAETGLSILLVDKSLPEISTVADRVVLLERGQSVWTGTPGALTPEVAGRYLGIAETSAPAGP